MSKKYSTLAIAAFVFSLLFFIPLFSIIGLICGIAALRQISKNKGLSGKGLAIAAIIIGGFITILQISFILLLYNLFGGFFGSVMNVVEKDPVQSIEYCKNKKAGTIKDMCIIIALSVHINQTEGIDKELCEEHVENIETKHFCNALLKKDKSYCYDITDTESRIKCFGLVEEIKK